MIWDWHLFYFNVGVVSATNRSDKCGCRDCCLKRSWVKPNQNSYRMGMVKVRFFFLKGRCWDWNGPWTIYGVTCQQLSCGRCRTRPGRIVHQSIHWSNILSSMCKGCCVPVLRSVSVRSECNGSIRVGDGGGISNLLTRLRGWYRLRYQRGRGVCTLSAKRLRIISGICMSTLRKLRFLRRYPWKIVLHGNISPEEKNVLIKRVQLVLPPKEIGSEPVCGRRRRQCKFWSTCTLHF